MYYKLLASISSHTSSLPSPEPFWTLCQHPYLQTASSILLSHLLISPSPPFSVYLRIPRVYIHSKSSFVISGDSADLNLLAQGQGHLLSILQVLDVMSRDKESEFQLVLAAYWRQKQNQGTENMSEARQSGPQNQTRATTVFQQSPFYLVSCKKFSLLIKSPGIFSVRFIISVATKTWL